MVEMTEEDKLAADLEDLKNMEKKSQTSTNVASAAMAVDDYGAFENTSTSSAPKKKRGPPSRKIASQILDNDLLS